MPPPGACPRTAAPRIGHGEGASLADAITLDDSDDEAAATAGDDDGDGDGAVEIVGSVGENALADFPHPRFACVVHPRVRPRPPQGRGARARRAPPQVPGGADGRSGRPRGGQAHVSAVLLLRL